MADKPPADAQPTQQTQPKKGEPLEIPVPKREDFDKLVRRAAKPRKPPPATEEQAGPSGKDAG